MQMRTPEDILRDAGGTTERQRPAETESPLGIWDAGDDDYLIPPRGWLLGNSLCRRYLSSLIADGGVGKTALRIAQLVSLAIGRSLAGEHVFSRCRVLIVSLEDDRDELRRRVLAVLRYHQIDPAELRGWLYLCAPRGIRLAELVEGSPRAGRLDAMLRTEIARLHIDAVSLDPLVKCHALDENANGAVDYVAGLLVAIGADHDCAVDAPHHQRKGAAVAGDASRGRGGSAHVDACRLVYTLTLMAAEEAERFGIAEAERRSYIRYDSAKVNIAPPSREARWYRLVGVPLGNGASIYPHGDEVQTVVPWQPPDTWAGLDHALLNRILDQIGAGLPNGSRYSGARSATDRAAWRVVIEHAPDRTEQQAREIIRAWLRSGTLYAEEYEDPQQRKSRSGLRVAAARRPS